MECNKEFKISCDGKEFATMNCAGNGMCMKCTEDGKNFFKEFFGKESKESC